MRSLKADEEKLLFKAMNYLKYRAERERLRRQKDSLDGQKEPPEVTRDLAEASRLRGILIRANYRLTVVAAKEFRTSLLTRDELVEEAGLKLLRTVDGFDVSKGWKFSTYFMTAARRAFMNLMRDPEVRNRAHERQVIAAQEYDTPPEPADYREDDAQARAQADELRDAINAALRRLNARDREVIILYFGLNDEPPLTQNEIGQRLGISPNRVSQLQNRALAALKKQLGGAFAELFAPDDD